VTSRVGAAAFLAASAFLVLAPQSRAQPGGNAEKGRDLYRRYSCWACHGYAGHGGAATPLVPMRMPLPGFSAFVRNPPTMPPYTTKVLSEAQLADIWAYVKTLPESPPAKSIPLLSQP
jgi:mono/diheme cytochrome c family protein